MKPDAGDYRMIFILLHALVAGLDVLEFLRISISRTIGKMLISEDSCWTIPLGIPRISRIYMLRDAFQKCFLL